MPRNQRPFGGAGEVATPLRRDERSGLLDIRTLSSIVESQQRARASHASASSVALPAFASTWALQDVGTPAPAASSRSPHSPHKVVVPDQRPLYMMIMMLSAAVVSLGALIAFKTSNQPGPSETILSVVAPAELPESATQEAEADPEPKDEPTSEAQPTDEPADQEPEDASAEAKDEASTKGKRPRPARPNRPGKKPPKADEETQPKPKPAKSDGPIPVECVIDPSQCSRTGKKKPKTGDDTTSTKGLPASPSSTAIRTAMSEVKPQAKACGPKHGGRSGEKVRVKLSVSGSTGKVTSATALEEHAGTALGRCVAGALSKASLPRFSKPQAGVVYAITL